MSYLARWLQVECSRAHQWRGMQNLGQDAAAASGPGLFGLFGLVGLFRHLVQSVPFARHPICMVCLIGCDSLGPSPSLTILVTMPASEMAAAFSYSLDACRGFSPPKLEGTLFLGHNASQRVATYHHGAMSLRCTQYGTRVPPVQVVPVLSRAA